MLRRSLRRLQLGGANQDPTASWSRTGETPYPVIMLPARSLWCKQQAVNLREIGTAEFERSVQRMQATRTHYKYPSMAAPQIGWNVQVFTLFDESVWINPEVKAAYSDTMGWAWEPSASSSFLMHFIERPYRITAGGYNRHGKYVEKDMAGMEARFFQHCMDYCDGVLFSRRIPDASHVVPMDGFHGMSEWADDFPSLEARSTNLYTTFIAPTTFIAESVPDSNLLDRHYDDGVYPGLEMHQAMLMQEKEQAALVGQLKQKARDRARKAQEMHERAK